MNTIKKDNSEYSAKASLNKRLLIKGAASATLVTTLVSRPALGAVCNASGFTSMHASGVIRHTSGICDGAKSPSEWLSDLTADGSLWVQANTNWIATYSGTPAFGPNVSFNSIFGTGSSSNQLFTIISDNTLERSTLVTFLNACLNEWGADINDPNIHPLDVIGLYQAGGSPYTTQKENVVEISDSDLKEFFDQTFSTS